MDDQSGRGPGRFGPAPLDTEPQRNVELKARVSSLAQLEQKVAELAEQGPEVLHQEDVFFSCSAGRLKLRILEPDRGQLIFYTRPDDRGPKESRFFISRVDETETMLRLLASAYGVAGVVRKRRVLYLIGSTRVHLDQVEGLGEHVELEVVLSEGQTVESGQKVAADLMSRLGICQDDLIEGAYIDLLMAEIAS